MANAVSVNTSELQGVYRQLKRMEKSMSRKEINSIQRRNFRPMVNEMKSASPYRRFQHGSVIGITTSRTKGAPPIGIRLGVIKNGTKDWFPDFTAPALASVLEHGTKERFRQNAKFFGVFIGAQSTGSVTANPWLRKTWDRNVRSAMMKTEKSYINKVEG